MSALNENAYTKLITVTGIDLNVLTPTQLYVVPSGKRLIVKSLCFRDASVNLTTAAFGVGYDNPVYDNLLPSTLMTTLTSAAIYNIIDATVGLDNIVGNSGDILTLLPTIAQGAPATITVDVFGFLV